MAAASQDAPERKFWWNSDHNSFSKFAVVAIVLALLFMLFVSNNSIIRYLRAKSTIAEQNVEMQRLREENASMEEQLEKLSSTTEKEKFAREHFRFTAPGEDLYILEE